LVIWRVALTDDARAQLAGIMDMRIRRTIAAAIEGLKERPDAQGKALVEDLKGFRSIRAVGQRYRIIYRCEADRVLVVVVTLGIRKEGDRKDAYRIAERLMRLGGLLPSEETEGVEEPPREADEQ